MTSITKLKSLSLKRLNNAEYGAFMDSFAQIIEQGTIAKLGIAEADRKAFKANLNKMIDANMQLKKDENSEALVQLDNDRDQLLTYFFMKISSEMRSPDPANEEAATQLGDFLIQYRGIRKSRTVKKPSSSKGLLLDAQQGKYTAPLQNPFSSTTVLTKLKKLNEDYEQLLDHRTNEGLAATFIATKPLRSEMDQQYDFLSTKLFALNVVSPLPESQKPSRVSITSSKQRWSHEDREMDSCISNLTKRKNKKTMELEAKKIGYLTTKRILNIIQDFSFIVYFSLVLSHKFTIVIYWILFCLFENALNYPLNFGFYCAGNSPRIRAFYCG